MTCRKARHSSARVNWYAECTCNISALLGLHWHKLVLLTMLIVCAMLRRRFVRLKSVIMHVSNSCCQRAWWTRCVATYAASLCCTSPLCTGSSRVCLHCCCHHTLHTRFMRNATHSAQHDDDSMICCRLHAARTQTTRSMTRSMTQANCNSSLLNSQ